MNTIVLKSIVHVNGRFCYNVVRDGEVVIVEMAPALLAGHNVVGREHQGRGHWDGMPADAIVAWKHEHLSGFYTEVVGDERDSILALEAKYDAAGWPARSS